MAKWEKGNWPPVNVKALVDNVKLVLRVKDIEKLHKTTYNFIILKLGFIAHYGLGGFQDEYQDVEKFRLTLLTSEYSSDPGYNARMAFRQAADRDFNKWYGERMVKRVDKSWRT